MANPQNAKSTTTSSGADESLSGIPDWHPGLRQTPWSAIILIVLMLACMGASTGIIATSDGQIVASWKITPAVLLALLSSVWNYSLGAALGISVTITWWRTARHGTTLASLHYIWNQGDALHPISALRSSAAARRVFLLAWLIIAVQIANNPLLQRATRTGAEDVIVADQMTLNIIPRLPDGWLGSVQDASTATIIGSRNGLSTVQQWWWNTTIVSPSPNKASSQCFGTCEGKVQSTGIDYHCTSTTTTLDLSAKENVGSVIFAINTTISTNATGAPILVLTTLHASGLDNSCIATLNLTTCNIEAAVVEYPIVAQNATFMLNIAKLSETAVVTKFISAGDRPTATKGQGAGPLEGLNDFFYYFTANVTLLIDESRNKSLYSGGGSLIPDLFFLPDASNYNETIFQKCALKWASPTQFILEKMHDFLFRASINASSDANSQTISVQRTSLALIFQSNYNYLAAALAVMLLALLAVLFQLWGWWELGRPVSLSPLELAKAFGAAVVPQTNSTSAANGLLRDTGDVNVRYTGEGFVLNVIRPQDRVEVRRGGDNEGTSSGGDSEETSGGGDSEE